MKIPKKIEEYIRAEIAVNIEGFRNFNEDKLENLQNNVWNEKQFDRYSEKDFSKEDWKNFVKIAFETLNWLRENRKAK